MNQPFFLGFTEFVQNWQWPLVLALFVAYLFQSRGIASRQQRFTALMSAYFFFVIFVYWIIKPIKKGMFIGHYKTHGGIFGMEPSQIELLAKEANVLIALVAALVLIWLRRRLPRANYSLLVVLLFALGLFAFVPYASRPGEGFVWAFYLYGDIFVSGMVALFFATLHDRCTVADSRSMYGLAGLGGVFGGVAGSAAANSIDQSIGPSGTVAACAAITCGVAVLAWLVSRYPVVSSAGEADPETGLRNPRNLLSGAHAVLRSPSLRLIAGMLLAYEIASVVMDYQFTTAVSREVPVNMLKSYFSSVYAFSNAMALLVQLFLATWMLRRFGAQTALLIMPLVILLGEAAYLAFPVLMAASLLNTADGAFAYSIQQTARESLYVPLRRDEKYEAKAFIDIVWLRLCKGIAVIVSLSLSLLLPSRSEAWLAVAVLLVAVIWLTMLTRSVQLPRFPWLPRASSSPL